MTWSSWGNGSAGWPASSVSQVGKDHQQIDANRLKSMSSSVMHRGFSPRFGREGQAQATSWSWDGQACHDKTSFGTQLREIEAYLDRTLSSVPKQKETP